MLKLPKLPERVPVKLSIQISPELNRTLLAYAEIYAETYGQREAMTDLVPVILQTFLEGDRHFAKAMRDRRLPVRGATNA
ncbi:hypothetical protein SAMN06295912_12916 [Sphingomonas laterariae]|uniref:DUF2274 domain-containing protein n=1 Tax=Edaphosphingomonas laterariae TaxID=861865 RepID=A0A239J0G9_9SPHN|nr:DUF2274 domain-containing protein [Sphingomonas laterariae]SNS99401.1 hypothetical protein SAMN06295912_12916 [Sphingomonas laterariae]